MKWKMALALLLHSCFSTYLQQKSLVVLQYFFPKYQQELSYKLQNVKKVKEILIPLFHAWLL